MVFMAIFVAGVTRFQIQVHGATRFRCLICLDPLLERHARAAAMDGMRQSLREILARKQLDHVSCEVAAVEALPPDPFAGKFRTIVHAPGSAPER